LEEIKELVRQPGKRFSPITDMAGKIGERHSELELGGWYNPPKRTGAGRKKPLEKNTTKHNERGAQARRGGTVRRGRPFRETGLNREI